MILLKLDFTRSPLNRQNQDYTFVTSYTGKRNGQNCRQGGLKEEVREGLPSEYDGRSQRDHLLHRYLPTTPEAGSWFCRCYVL